MTYVEHTRLASFQALVHEFHVLEHHAPPDVRLTDGEHLHTLHQVVAEPMVEPAFDLSDLLCGLLWERGGEIAAHHLPPITYHIINKQIETIGDHIMNSHRQEREQIQDGVYKIVQQFHFFRISPTKIQRKVKSDRFFYKKSHISHFFCIFAT